MADLPPEIVSEILSRVPAMTLLRFRCVSKSWRSTIDSPGFIKIHLNQTIRSNSDRKLLLNSLSLYSADLDAFERTDRFVYVEHDDRPLKSPDAVCLVVGSCHGLLCSISHYPREQEIEDKSVSLWNPTTRKQFKLPFTGYEFPDNLEYFTWSLNYGFGYDSVSDDYKVLQIIQAYDCYSEVKIFSVKSNSWKKLPPFPYYMQYGGANGLLVGGSLYWLICINPEIEHENFICAFDLAAEEFRLVPRPSNLSKGKFVMDVVCLRESLCVACYYFRYLDFWVQEKYAAEEPWTKMFRLRLDCFVKPVAFSSCGRKVLMVQDHNALLWYDLEKKETVCSPFCISEASGSMGYEYQLYFGSLVQPGGSDGWVSDRKRRALGSKGTKTKGKKKDDEFLSVGFKLVL